MTQTITAKDVAELRALTGAGMMDCKRALEEAGGDIARATEILRAKGIAKAEKRAGRSTSQGLVNGMVTPDADTGALIELTCETDFVARNEDFQTAAASLLDQAVAAGAIDLEALMARPGPNGQTVAEQVTALTAKTGENVALRRVAYFAAGDTGTIGLYLHHNRQVGVMVELACGSQGVARGSAAQELARELALHIASADPVGVRAEDVPADVLDRERRIAMEQVAAEGKPEAIRAKIVDGKVKKFVAERTLLQQPWVKEPDKTIGQLVDEKSKTAGTALTVTRFVRLKVGEG